MTEAYTLAEVQEIVNSLKEAYKKAIASGGVTSYTLKSGQGESTVQQASLAEINSQLKQFSSLLNEMKAVQSGSCFTVMRGIGL